MRPSGLSISGISLSRARSITLLDYLFQGKIREEYGRLNTIFRSRLLSELCITHRHAAELVLKDNVADEAIEQEVITCLRSRVDHD